MSSGQTIPFTRQYNSFRVSNNSNEKSNNNRSSLKHKGGLRNGKPTDETGSVSSVEMSQAVLTPRLSRRSNGAHLANTHTIASKLKIESSPLRSPQIIRSTRMSQGVNKLGSTGSVSSQPTKGCSLHSKSPGSSGTSVESIVPKYGNNSALLNRTNNIYALVNNNNNNHSSSCGSQKRAYNINITSNNKASNKMINTRSSGGSCTANKHHHSINNTIATRTASTTTTPSNNMINHVHSQNQHANNHHHTATMHLNNNNNIIGKKSKENFTSYSSKYPNGLPFEEEFYHRRKKSLSETSSSNTLSSSESSDLSGHHHNHNHHHFPFEDDEFTRKPSNEALYVDFTKPLFNHTNNNNSCNGNGNATQIELKQSKKCTSSAPMMIGNGNGNGNAKINNRLTKNPLAEYNRRTVLSSSGCNIHHHQQQSHQLYLNNNNTENHGLYKENGHKPFHNGKIVTGDSLEVASKNNRKPPVTFVPASAWTTDKHIHPDIDDDSSDEGVESDTMEIIDDVYVFHNYFIKFNLTFRY